MSFWPGRGFTPADYQGENWTRAGVKERGKQQHDISEERYHRLIASLENKVVLKPGRDDKPFAHHGGGFEMHFSPLGRSNRQAAAAAARSSTPHIDTRKGLPHDVSFDAYKDYKLENDSSVFFCRKADGSLDRDQADSLAWENEVDWRAQEAGILRQTSELKPFLG